MAGQLIVAQFGFPAEFDRQVDAAILRIVEFEATAEIGIAIGALIDFVHPGFRVDGADRPNPHAQRPGGVRIGGVADIAARQRLWITAQHVVHEIAVQRRTGEIAFHVHAADGDIQPAVEQSFLRIDRNQVHGDIAARPIDFLHRQKTVAE